MLVRNLMRYRNPVLLLVLSASVLAMAFACSTARHPPMATVARVDLPRFMGDWAVQGGVLTSLERGAHNAVETYELLPDGSIQTTFTFRRAGFDGPVKTYRPRGFILDSETNALWGMRFVWPFKADYRIVHLDEAYSETIIARQKRDYAWIMTRATVIGDADFDRLVAMLADLGYDTSKVVRVPQQAPSRP